MTGPIQSTFFRQLWGLNIMPKWKMFIWKMWHNCLATASNLQYRGIPISNHCHTCLHDDEDDQHIFRKCPLALEAWGRSSLNISPLDFPDLSVASWLEYWIGKFRIEDGHGSSRLTSFINTLWAIWNVRNGQVFRQVRATLSTFDAQVQEGASQHSRFIETDVITPPPPPAPNYGRPPGFILAHLGRVTVGTPDVIIQFDGSWKARDGSGGTAFVVHQQDQQIHQQGTFTYTSSALQAEALAGLQAL